MKISVGSLRSSLLRAHTQLLSNSQQPIFNIARSHTRVGPKASLVRLNIALSTYLICYLRRTWLAAFMPSSGSSFIILGAVWLLVYRNSVAIGPLSLRRSRWLVVLPYLLIHDKSVALMGVSVGSCHTVAIPLIGAGFIYYLLALPCSKLVLLAHFCAWHATLFQPMANSGHLPRLTAVGCVLVTPLARLQVLDHGTSRLWALQKVPGYRCLLQSMILSSLRAQ